MSTINRISKNLLALFTSNGINVVWNLLLPPIFLHKYGTSLYGEWLALSASVSYLSTLNFGVQTYVNQDLTVRYHSGNLEGFKTQQSTALRLLIGIALVGAVVSLGLFLVPFQRMLHLTIPQSEARLAAYFLALQILVNILFGYFGGSFMVIARSHRGTHWNNIQRIAILLATAAFAWMHSSFALVAVAQLLVCVACLAGILIDIRIVAPDIFPTLRYWDGKAVAAILKPSGYFGLIMSSTFLAYQLPVLILQRIVGPTVVVVFTLMRTIFSMARQILNGMTQSMGPEITRLYGKQDWAGLSLLYSYSERFIFFCIPVVNLGVLSISPMLLTLWLHKGGLFSLPLYAMMTAISFAMCAKEHKFNFQFSTNTHEDLARVMFFSYLLMSPLAIVLVHFYGVMGMLIAWLVVEVFQLAYIMRLNLSLFSSHEKVGIIYVVRLAAFSLVGTAATAFILRCTLDRTLVVRIGSALAEGLLVAAVSYLTFDMAGVARMFLPKLTRRLGFVR